jgi:hypothetical protein
MNGLMTPSVFERENYCFSLYELCPLFASDVKDNYANISESDCVLIESEV